ncbi:MAG: CapA family protein [Methylobacter sp.]
MISAPSLPTLSSWGGACNDKPGVNVLPDLSGDTVSRIAERISGLKQKHDWVVASIHWGGNWGYKISDAHREFAHQLIDQAQVDVVHGHSSHHPKGVEIYHGKLIIFGCGDFLNDYEGISGYQEFRGNLVLMYFVTMDLTTRSLANLIMTPMQIKRFRLNYAHPHDVHWLQQVMDRESQPLGARIGLINDYYLALVRH